MADRVDVERLRELSKAATKPPWSADYLWSVLRYADKHGDPFDHIAEDEPDDINWPHRDDAELIAETRAALPALLDLVEAADRLAASLAVEENGYCAACGTEDTHLDDCTFDAYQRQRLRNPGGEGS